ncbi:hypothetical protein T492DRAFT_897338 [Pavlovales sp. CCMP2436]|nr:hypothetical protein T492DRAFT_897338 [Pavlovales sp. CCMP2436]
MAAAPSAQASAPTNLSAFAFASPFSAASAASAAGIFLAPEIHVASRASRGARPTSEESATFAKGSKGSIEICAMTDPSAAAAASLAAGRASA